MPPKELTLLRRGFRLGYCAALRRARRDLLDLAANFDAELDEVRAEMRATRDVYNRLRAVEDAIAVERDFNTLLN